MDDLITQGENMRLIRHENRIINAAQIIEAVFTAPGTGLEYKRSASLHLRFAAPQSEPHTNHKGDDHSPYESTLRGSEAEAMWRKLERMCEE
jgi:hypothetical protein